MWILLALAYAGAPIHTCDVDDQGGIVFISPRDSRIRVVRDQQLRRVDVQNMPAHGQYELDVIVVHPDGGWWVGTNPTWRVTQDGTLTKVETLPEPSSLWEHLSGRRSAARDSDGSVVRVETHEGRTVLVRLRGDERTELHEYPSAHDVPYSVEASEGHIYEVTPKRVTHRDAGGEVRTWSAPPGGAVSVCGGGKYPINVVTSRPSCLYQWTGERWKSFGCPEPPVP